MGHRAALALALLLAAPLARAQDNVAATDPPGGTTVDGAVATDPVAIWQADPLAVLDGGAVELAGFEYLARPFVIFADSPRQPQLAEQLRLIAAEAEDLGARDVAVIVDSDPAARSPLRLALRPRGFGVVLVDKDGRVALRRPAPLTVRDIAGAIDRSPIRQEEMRAAGH